MVYVFAVTSLIQRKLTLIRWIYATARIVRSSAVRLFRVIAPALDGSFRLLTGEPTIYEDSGKRPSPKSRILSEVRHCDLFRTGRQQLPIFRFARRHAATVSRDCSEACLLAPIIAPPGLANCRGCPGTTPNSSPRSRFVSSRMMVDVLGFGGCPR
jgi:hypothetical protein